MSRKRVNSEAILTNAERQKRHRAKIKTELAKLETLKTANVSAGEPAPDLTAIREQIKAELKNLRTHASARPYMIALLPK